MSVSIGKSFSIVYTDLVLNLDSAFNGNYILSEVEVLVVAGGGGGGGWGGGGVGGGVLYDSSHGVTPVSAISVTVGSGGARGVASYTSGGDGTNSVFSTMTAIGGGGGGYYNSVNGRAGGSGGGGGGGEANTYGFLTTGGTGTPGQGNNGGSGGGRPGSDLYNPGGGGGGAGEPGYNFDSTFSGASLRIGGKGGDGLPFNISGKYSYYGGGGGGHTDGRSADNTATSSFGGKGGGGRGGSYSNTYALNGANGTGGGGGGSYGGGGQDCGIGGSGVVIVRYPGPQKATGGNTITQVGGYTIHTFTSSGTFTPLAVPANGGAVYGLQDLSLNSHTALSYGSPTYNSANGGNINYNGSNYLEIKHTELLKPSTGFLTVIAWFNTPGGGSENDPIIFNKENEYEVAVGGGYVSMAIRPDWAWRRISSVNNNQWYCIAVSHDGTNQKAYLNGIESYTNPVAGQVGVSYANDLRIAARNSPNAASSLFTGIIGPIQIYNRALSAAEITQNFNALRGRFGI